MTRSCLMVVLGCLCGCGQAQDSPKAIQPGPAKSLASPTAEELPRLAAGTEATLIGPDGEESVLAYRPGEKRRRDEAIAKKQRFETDMFSVKTGVKVRVLADDQDGDDRHVDFTILEGDQAQQSGSVGREYIKPLPR